MTKLNHKIEYYSNGNKWYEEYSLNGRLHNTNGPATIHYYPNGNIKYEEYYLNGKCHNENGPAIISYYENGNKIYEDYYLNDELLYVNSTKELKTYLKTLILK